MHESSYHFHSKAHPTCLKGRLTPQQWNTNILKGGSFASLTKWSQKSSTRSSKPRCFFVFETYYGVEVTQIQNSSTFKPLRLSKPASDFERRPSTGGDRGVGLIVPWEHQFSQILKEPLHPRKLTRQWKNNHLKMYLLLLKMMVFHCQVCFLEGTTSIYNCANKGRTIQFARNTGNMLHQISHLSDQW